MESAVQAPDRITSFVNQWIMENVSATTYIEAEDDRHIRDLCRKLSAAASERGISPADIEGCVGDPVELIADALVKSVDNLAAG